MTAVALGRSSGLVDTFGRVATDLRVSLTDRCNLRCTYCMPAEGLRWLPREEVLTDDEVIRLVRVAVDQLGIREVRFTGGEPLIRPGLERILAGTTALRPRVEVSLTTNGIGLAARARRLAESGLTRINVSLDTLRSERFVQLTRRDRIGDVLAGLAAANAAGLRPIKVNAVLMRGVNDDEAAELLQFCLDHGFELRFIEQMPFDADRAWQRENMVTAREILDRLGERFTLTEVSESRGSAPAERWLVDGGPAVAAAGEMADERHALGRGQGAEHEVESFGMGQLDLLLSQHRRLLAGWPARLAVCLRP